MRIGVLADTHDNVRAIRYLTEWFETQSVEALIHAGDFVSPFTIPALANFSGPVYGVFGNNDGDRETLMNKAEQTDITLEPAPREIELNGTKIILSHKPADLPDPLEQYDLVIHGHTHERRIENNTNHLLLNPGEAGGWLTHTTSAAVFDSATKNASFNTVPAP